MNSLCIRNSPTQIIWTKLRPGDDQMTMADQSLGSSQAANFEMYHFFWEYQDFLKKIQVATLNKTKKMKILPKIFIHIRCSNERSVGFDILLIPAEFQTEPLATKWYLQRNSFSLQDL